MIVTKLKRVFIVDGKEVSDPLPNGTLNDVQKALSSNNASLTNASINGPEIRAGKEVYTFSAKPGTKG